MWVGEGKISALDDRRVDGAGEGCHIREAEDGLLVHVCRQTVQAADEERANGMLQINVWCHDENPRKVSEHTTTS